MVTEGMKAGVKVWVRFMELAFSADTIDRLFATLRLIPKELLEEKSIALKKKVESAGESLTEEQALEILKELEAEMATPGTQPRTTN